MLSSLFKPAWQSGSVEKRLRAISSMDGTSVEKQQILAQLATEDVEASVQIAAINKLTNAMRLHELTLNSANDSVRLKAESRLNEVLGENSSLSDQDYRELINRFTELRVRIAAQATTASIRAEALQNIPTEQLLEVLELTVYTDARQQIAERISTIEMLEPARKNLRGKDKNAERLIKAKIDEIRNIERQNAENLNIVEKLIDEVEYLASHDWLSEFKAKLLAHRNHWDKLAFDIDEKLRQRYKVARKIIDSRYEEQKVIEETHCSQDQVVDEVESFLKSIANMDLAGSIDALKESLDKQTQFRTRWQELSVKARPTLIQDELVDKMLRAMQSASELLTSARGILQPEVVSEQTETDKSKETADINKLENNSQKLNAVLKKLKWPAEFGEFKLETDLLLQLTSWKKAQKASAVEYQERLDLSHKKIGSIFHFSRTGNLMRAKQFYERAEKSLHQFNSKDRSKLEERLAEAHEALDKMGDWKNFATEPKYLELCDAMELLGKSKHHPDKLSKEIKDLQQSWKLLGHSDISDQYWPRFKEAADKVYQPCADFFDKRHKTRKDNLQQRQQIVDQLRELLENTDWDNNPDYKAVQSSLRSLGEKFSKIKEVEFGPGQKQWKIYSTLKDDVYEKLNVAYEANIKLKQQLIVQATTLAEGDARTENLAALKILQTRWKQVGVTRRNADQKAWKEFKKQG
ncbi:MAG: DUF349 domain-containing protein, partial [Thiotrichaceae bacterium]|nr:DUF349 domain-containing protein [Thiotrichaceae bacterium]